MKSFTQSNEIFNKIINQIKNYSNCYEKVFIIRTYSEFLLEENKDSIEGNSKYALKKII